MRKLLIFTSSGSEASVEFQKQFALVNLGELEYKTFNLDVELDRAVTFHLSGVPTMIIMEDGREVKRSTGYLTKEEIEEFVQ